VGRNRFSGQDLGRGPKKIENHWCNSFERFIAFDFDCIALNLIAFRRVDRRNSIDRS